MFRGMVQNRPRSEKIYCKFIYGVCKMVTKISNPIIGRKTFKIQCFFFCFFFFGGGGVPVFLPEADPCNVSGKMSMSAFQCCPHRVCH